MMFKKAPVHIIGDSMMRKTPDFLRREVECTSIGGAKILDVKKILEERLREGALYEKTRRETNRMLCKELLKMKMEWLTEKGNVSFLDLDGILDHDRLFNRDGVHLNQDGNQKMGRRLAEWMRTRQVCCVETA
ncbi:hypothetical protein E2C01_082051 [Portunus trituberculatus]|uniref:Uncharacterized protein n=1 Tax=Portunus trituberculatus TaxID=210409 RepID=A0A5B7IXE7_PORTR|nr:hypothetical protein [Portunus trituberculatus]